MRTVAFATMHVCCACALTSFVVGADARTTIVSHSPSETIFVSQCGLTVTIVACEYFGVGYDAATLYDRVPSTDAGISLQALVGLLEGHGLQASAREGLTLSSLANALSHERIAILPLKAGGGVRHYFVAMLNSSGEPVLVDAPVGVRPLYVALTEAALTEAKGLALFVSPREGDKRPLADSLKIDPPLVNLGDFATSGPTASVPIEVTLRLTCEGSFPVFVSAVDSSCGCTKPQWRGGVMRPGDTQRVRLSVIPGAWGDGTATRYAIVKCPDGSQRSVSITGSGRSAAALSGLEFTPTSFAFELGQADASGKVTSLLVVSGDDVSISRAHVTGSVGWVKIEEIPSLNKKHRAFALSLDLAHPDLRPVRECSLAEFATSVSVEGRHHDRVAVSVPIRVYNRAVGLSPALIDIRPGTTVEGRVDVTHPAFPPPV